MNLIRSLRSRSGLTQQELASAAKTSQPTIAAYEKGTKSPTLETLQRMAHAVGCEVAVTFVPPLTREDQRSLSYHHAVAEKLRRDPEAVIAKARGNLSLMAEKQPGARKLFDVWESWLALPLGELIALMLDPGMLARDLRQVTPFAGVLGAKERMLVLRRFRAEEKRDDQK